MSEKKLTTRIQQKTDTKANWDKATNFVPLKGEYIYYSDLHKVKVGDGVTKVGSLPFLADSDTHQSIKTLNTNNTAAQTPSANESIAGSGTINLHKVAKTGSYNDLNDKPTTLSGYGITDAYTKTEADGKYVTIDTEQTVSAKKSFTDTIEVKGAEINAETRVGTYPSSIEATGTLNVEDAVDNWVKDKRVFENHKISSGTYLYFEYPELLEHYGLYGANGASSIPASAYTLNKDVSIPETITTEEQLKAYVKSSDFASAVDSAGYTVVIYFMRNDVATYHSDIQSISFNGTNIVGDDSLDCQKGEGEQIVGASDPITEPMLKTKNLKVENLEVENSLIKNMNVGGSLSVGGKNVLTSVTAGSGISIETSDDGTVKIACSYSDGDMETY